MESEQIRDMQEALKRMHDILEELKLASSTHTYILDQDGTPVRVTPDMFDESVR